MIEQQKLFFIIVGRAHAKQTVRLLNRNGFKYHVAMLARGTAPTEIQGYFGLSEPEKALIMCFAQESRAQELLKLLDGENDFRKPNTGIAFSVRLSGMAGMSVLNYIKDNE